MAEMGMAEEIDVVTPLARTYSWRPPRWMLPAALAVGVTLWAGGVGWMAAHLGGSDAPASDSHALTDEVSVLRAKVDSLTQQTAALGQEREALAKRVAAIEARPAAPAIAAPAATTPATPATPATQPAIVPMDLTATAEAYSIPRFAYPRTADPQTAAAQVFSGAVPARAGATPAGASASARFVTNGADKYNCTSFGSQAEAQEALAANVPGDPNRLDMNGNGVACEDITYPANTPKNLTPIANR